ncbi:MAG: nucleotide exchange factor GrpE [Pseudomonadota bacterium]
MNTSENAPGHEAAKPDADAETQTETGATTAGTGSNADAAVRDAARDAAAHARSEFGQREIDPADAAADAEERGEFHDDAPGDEAASEPHGWGKSTLAALKKKLGGDTAAEAVTDEITKLVEENADLKDRMLRMAAEMENLRKRTEREKADTSKFAISRFAEDMLSVGDNLQRALSAVPEDLEDKDAALRTLRDGISMTGQELDRKLEKHGVVKDEPLGAPFDPNKHQAIAQVEHATVPAQHVAEVFQSGYAIAERTLRPAMVVVSQGAPKAPVEGNANEEGATGET